MIEFAILPHPKAPLFKDQATGQEVIRQLIVDIENGLLRSDFNRLIEVIRQAGLVSLYFYLRYIASATGPYGFLNESIHLDMCNFRQSEVCMRDGAAVAIFLPRQFAKTTVFTTGASGWELLRDAEKRVLITNATAKKAQEFAETVHRMFALNPLIKLLYPECVPDKDDYTKLRLNMPNAKIRYNEPSLSSVGVDGASAGGHYDILQNDDIIGLENVDANYQANLSMDAVQTWMDVNLEALLVSREYSRKFIVGTRYGPGDVYESVWNDCKKFHGYIHPNAKPRTDGQWDIYYRSVIENGVATNPFVMTVESASKMQHDKPLTYAYQYANDVTVNLTNEFGQFEPGKCKLGQHAETKEWYIRVFNDNKEEQWIPLSECSTCISVDWAGSERRRSTRTSRSSIALWAADDQNRRYRLDQYVGFFNIMDVFDKIYSLGEKWQGYVNVVLIEANAMQLAVAQLIESQDRFRKIGLSFVRRNAVGDKMVRIRTNLGPYLTAGLIHLTDTTSIEFNEERLGFGPGSTKLDVLDESEKAISWLISPLSDDDRRNRQDKLDESSVEQYATFDDTVQEDREVSLFPY
jgi:hypothetical protein